MDRNAAALNSLTLAFDALGDAAAELSLATALTTDSALGTEARVLAVAVEAELAALHAVISRHH